MPVYDFSSGLNLLNQGINTLGSALGNRADTQAYAGIGDALARGDYQGAAARAWQAGKPDLALKLQSQAMTMGTIGGGIPPEGSGGGGAAAASTSTTPTTLPTDGSSPPPKTTVSAGSPGNRWAPQGATANDVQDYIRQSAIARGIDPDVAVKVAHSEWGASYTGDQGRSYGPFQLFTGGGLGNQAIQAGIDVTNPATWKQQVDFALDHAATSGWGAWYGARNTGIPSNAGLANAKPIGVGRAGYAGGPGAAGGANIITTPAAPGERAGPTLPAPGSLTPDATAAAPGQPTPTSGSLGASMLSATKLLQSGQVTLAQLQQNFGKYGLPDPANPQSQPVWANLGKVAGPGRQAGGVGALNLPQVPGPQGGAVPAALPPGQGPAPGTPGPGKPAELGTPIPAPPAAGPVQPGMSPALASGGPQGGAPGSAPAPASPMLAGNPQQTAMQLLQQGIPLADLQSQFMRYGLPNPNVPANKPFWDQLASSSAAGAGAAKPPPTDAQATMPLVPETPFPGASQAIPGLIPAQGGFGDQPPRQKPPDTFTDPLTGLRMPSPPDRQAAPAPPVPGGPPGYSPSRTGAGAASEADPRAVAGVARDVPAVHTPAAVPASLQPRSGSTPVQGPAGPAPPRPSQAEMQRFLGPAASNAAADFGVAPSAIRGAPQAQAPMPPSTAATRAPFPAAPGGPGAAPGGPGAPGPGGGGNPIMALLQGLGIGPQPGGGAQPAALPPGGPPPGAQAPGAAPQAGGGPGILGGLLNLASMQPPGGVPGLQSPASSLGYGAPRPMPGQPGFPGGAPPPLAGGAPGPVMAGGPGAGAPGAAPGAAQPGAPPTPAQVNQAVQTVGNAPADATLDNLKQRSAWLHNRAIQMSAWSPEMAKPFEDAANSLDGRISKLEEQRTGATIKSGEISEQARSTQANESIKNLGTDYGKLTSATGPESLIRNVNEMESEIGKSAVGFGTAQGAMEHILGTLAPFDPSIAAIAGNTQLLKGRANIELAQMANQLYPTRLNRVEFNALRDGTLDLSTRPDVLFDLLEMSKQRAISLVDQHNKSVDRTAEAFPQYGGKEAKTMYRVDLPDELRAPGDRDAALGKPKTTQGGKAPPKVGTIEDGHRFTGGDPANPANWEVVK